MIIIKFNKNSETKKRSKSKKNLISPYNNKLLAPNNIYKNKKIFQNNSKNLSNNNYYYRFINTKLSRSESFSIIRSNNSIFNNSIKENNIKQESVNKNQNQNEKRNKIIKKIYKIESICQVGYSGPGMIKYNQDNFFVYNNLNDENNILFIGVCDGHGILGHDVSRYLIHHLPSNLNKALKKQGNI